MKTFSRSKWLLTFLFLSSPVFAQEIPCGKMNAMECRMFEAINQQRKILRVGPLTVLTPCVQAAQDHAMDMATQDYFAHDGPGETWEERMNRFDLLNSKVGENIAYSTNSPNTSEQAEELVISTVHRWMNSPMHRKNILDSGYRSTGLGYAKGYWVQCFSGQLEKNPNGQKE